MSLLLFAMSHRGVENLMIKMKRLYFSVTNLPLLHFENCFLVDLTSLSNEEPLFFIYLLTPSCFGLGNFLADLPVGCVIHFVDSLLFVSRF
jgi:hypothetical protein